MTKLPLKLAAFIVTACAVTGVQAADLPTLQDAHAAAVLGKAEALLEKAGTSGYLDMPEGGKPWPCPVTSLQLRKLGNLLNDDERDDKTKKTMERMYNDAGMKSSDLKSSVKNVSYAPIVATCKDGKLDGELEFVMEATRVMEMPTATTESTSRTRYLFTMSAGKLVETAPSTQASTQVSMAMTYKDPKIQELVGKNRLPQIKSVTATYVEPVDKDTSYVAAITETRKGFFSKEYVTSLMLPTGPKRMESRSYRGAELFTVMHWKNGKMHGESRTYPFTVGGYSAPGSTVCYEDGEVIKTTNCQVD
jgi:hypothetical protein